jgi:type IV pilus assembly protein PilO
MEKMRQWSILTAVTVAVVLALGWVALISPQHSRASSLRTQAADSDQANSKLLAQIGQYQQQQKNLPAEEKIIDGVNTKVPDNPALPSLIRQLSAAATGAGVDLSSLSPSTPTLVSAASGRLPSVGAASHGVAGGVLAQIPVTIQVQGSYFNVESFLSAIENLSRAMMVTSFSLAPDGSAAPAGSTAGTPTGVKVVPPGTLSASIQAVVYLSPSLAPASSPVTPTQAK